MSELFASLREFRRPIGLIAIGLVALQCLLAGLAGAEAAARAASGEISILCHNGPDDGGAGPSGAKSGHDCCAVCVTWAATNAPKAGGQVERIDLAGFASPSIAPRDPVPIAPRAVRSGPSQAPPVSG